jgi:hypothetical protein
MTGEQRTRAIGEVEGRACITDRGPVRPVVRASKEIRLSMRSAMTLGEIKPAGRRRSGLRRSGRGEMRYHAS